MAWVEYVRYCVPDGPLDARSGSETAGVHGNRVRGLALDQRRGQLVEPGCSRMTTGEWIREWSQAHHVGEAARATYGCHIRNHILPEWGGTALGDIRRIEVKGWANRTLRATLADRSV